MAHIFISYKRKNKERVYSLIKKIESNTGVKCWVDLDGIESSVQFASKICAAIDNAEVILFMHSSEHLLIDFENDWTIKELNYAHARKKSIILVKLDNSPLENIFLMEYGSKNNIDSNDPLQVEKLILDLRHIFNLPQNKVNIKDIVNTIKLKIIVDETCNIFLDGVKQKKASKGIPTYIDNIKRNSDYTLTFISLAYKGSQIIREIHTNSLQEYETITISFAEVRRQQKDQVQKQREENRKKKSEHREKEGILKQVLNTYDSYSEIKSGMIVVYLNNKVGFVDKRGFEIIPCKYENATFFQGEFASVSISNKWGIINKEGKEIVQIFSDSPCWMSFDGIHYISSKNGRYTISSIYDSIPSTFPYSAIKLLKDFPYYIVKIDSIWYIVNGKGEPAILNNNAMAINGCRNYYISTFIKSSDIMEICYPPLIVQDTQSRRFGYYNKRLEQTIPYIDEGSDRSSFRDDIVITKTNGKMALVNIENGSYVIPPIYDNIYHYYFDDGIDRFRISNSSSNAFCTYHFQDGNYIADNDTYNDYHRIGGQQGICNINGEIIIPMYFQLITIEDYKKQPFFICYQLDNLVISYLPSHYSNATMSIKHTFDKEKSKVYIYSIHGDLLKIVSYSNYEDISSIMNEL